MKRIIQIGLIVLSLFTFHLSLSAADIECVGKATEVLNGTDTTYVFLDEIHLKSNIGPLTWLNADGTEYASGVEEIFPYEGCYSAGGHHFCVQKYKDIDELSFTIEPGCENTVLRVTGDVSSLARTYSLSYNALAWNGEAWEDSAATTTGTLTSAISLPALYAATPITLCYDPEVRAALDLDSACVTVELHEDEVKAVDFRLTSLATTRGKEGEKSNERNRPTSQTLITGSEYSGPLEVAFYSNPTPAVQFYKWSIYKATEQIVTRTDRDIRYTFNEPGSYRIECEVSNPHCSTEPMEMTVAVSESYLAVPNVFTPNGDGKNDEFRVAYRSLREFHCWIYNRWGKLVYAWDDPAKGWDGNIGGRPASEGAYYYVIRAMGTDAAKDAQYMGKISYKNQKISGNEAVIGVYQLSGDINLLRGKR